MLTLWGSDGFEREAAVAALPPCSCSSVVIYTKRWHLPSKAHSEINLLKELFDLGCKVVNLFISKVLSWPMEPDRILEHPRSFPDVSQMSPRSLQMPSRRLPDDLSQVSPSRCFISGRLLHGVLSHVFPPRCLAEVLKIIVWGLTLGSCSIMSWSYGSLYQEIVFCYYHRRLCQ